MKIVVIFKDKSVTILENVCHFHLVYTKLEYLDEQTMHYNTLTNVMAIQVEKAD